MAMGLDVVMAMGLDEVTDVMTAEQMTGEQMTAVGLEKDAYGSLMMMGEGMMVRG